MACGDGATSTLMSPVAWWALASWNGSWAIPSMVPASRAFRRAVGSVIDVIMSESTYGLPVAQLHLVHGGVAVRVPLEREPGRRRQVGVHDHHRVIQVLDAALVDRRDADERVEGLGGAAADEAELELAAAAGGARGAGCGR